MKKLKPVHLKPSYYKDIEKEIIDFFKIVIFDPLVDIMRESGIEVKNSNGALYDALQSGRVYYDGGYVHGNFNAKISSELRKAGASYNRSKRAWHLPMSSATPEIKIAIQFAESNMVDLQEKLVQKLDSIDVGYQLSQYEFNFDDTAKKTNEDLEKTLKDMTIPVEFTEEQLGSIKKAWQENLELYIKEWADDNILSLRKDITQNVTTGRRASQLEKFISKKYAASKNKARFLARQETSLLLSKMREARYGNAGIFKYQWSTSKDSRVRDRHAHLDGMVFTWDDPPVVDLVTGRKANPGEDFNCRCVAIPIIE